MAITNEDFNLFHSIDRELFSLLILNLGRDTAESMQVMAFWLWLERAGHDHRLVEKMLLLPGTLINALADETLTCLKCIENDDFPLNLEGNDISTLQCLINTGIDLRFFHENRLAVLRGVTKVVNEVCARAFEDILRQTTSGSRNTTFGSSFENNGENANMVSGGYYYHHPVITTVPFCPGIGVVSQMGFNVPPFWPNHGPPSDKINGVPTNIVPTVLQTYDPYDLALQRQFLNNELGDLLSRINLTVVDEDQKEVPPDDRTIFLTFSKGYPISESEVRDFFTRNFGDFVEAIFMQEVQPDEQVLYARLVARSVSIIDVVLDGKSKAKFSINGKHVWARKYVRKQPKSPQRATSPPQPTSPVAVPQP